MGPWSGMGGSTLLGCAFFYKKNLICIVEANENHRFKKKKLDRTCNYYESLE